MAVANNTLAILQRNGISVDDFWSMRILEMIKLERTNFVFSNLGVEMSLPRKEGTKTYTIRRYNHLPYNPNGDKHVLVEGTAPTPMKVEAQSVSCVINQFGALIEETDVADDIHFDNIFNIYQPEMSRHAAEVIERNIIDSFTDASEYFVGTGNDSVNDIAADDTPTLKDFRIVSLIMSNANRGGHRKYGNKFVAVMHPNIMNDLLDDDALVNKLLVPGNENGPIKQGTLAKYMAYGMYFVESLICPVEANTGNVNVYTSYVLGRDPYMVLSLGNSGIRFYDVGFKADSYNPLAQKATLGYKFWTGAKILDPLAITAVYSASAYDVALYDATDDTYGAAADQSAISN